MSLKLAILRSRLSRGEDRVVRETVLRIALSITKATSYAPTHRAASVCPEELGHKKGKERGLKSLPAHRPYR